MDPVTKAGAGALAKKLGLSVGAMAAYPILGVIMSMLFDKIGGGESAAAQQRREQDLQRLQLQTEAKRTQTDRAAQTALRQEEGRGALVDELGAIRSEGGAAHQAIGQNLAMDPEATMNSPIPISSIFNLIY